MDNSKSVRDFNTHKKLPVTSVLMDMDGLITASQILSSETDLKQLLIKMMELLKSNAGADRIVLLLKENENWLVQALDGILTKNNSMLVKQIFDLESIKGDLIPETIFNYFLRSKEVLVIENAEIDERFAKDNLIQTNKIKSITYIPMMGHGALMGMVYLENRKLENVFNLERMKFLKYISSQFWVSAENLLLYENLKKKMLVQSESEIKLRLVFEHAQETIIVAQNEKIKYCNPQITELTGYSLDEIYSMNFIDLIHPDDKELVIQEYQSRISGDKTKNRYSVRLITKGGQEKPILISSNLMDWDGESASLAMITDITQLKKAESDLKLSEERYELAVEGSAAGIWDWDILIDKLYTSTRLKKLIGYESDEIDISMDDFFNLLHPEDIDKVQLGLEKHLKEHLDYDVNYRLQTKSGEYRWFRARGQALWDKTGKAIRMSGSITDITQRKRADSDLKLSEERYELAVEGSAAGIWDWDMVTGEFYFSEKLQKLLGYEPSEFKDSLQDLWDRMHPDDIEATQLDLDLHLKKQKAQHLVESRLRTKSGEYRWFQASSKAVWDDNDKPIRLAGSFIDITERKNAESNLIVSEERYKLAIDGSSVGIWDYNIITDEVYYSDRFNELLGYEPQEMYDSPPEVSWNRIHPDYRDAAIFALQQHLEKKIPFYLIDYLAQTKLGEYRWFQARGKAVWDENGNPTRVAGSLVDIHQQREAEEKVIRSKNRFRLLVEQSPLAMELLSPDGKINLINSAWKKLWKVSDEEAAETVEKYNMLTDPQLEKLGVMEEVKKAFKGKHIILPPVKYDTGQAKDDFDIKQLKNFRSPWVQCHLNTVKQANGAIDFVVNTYVDITDLKEAEEILSKSEARYRHLVEHSPLSIAIFTPDGKLNQVNTAWKNLWGLNEEETRQVMENYNIFTDKQIEEYGHAPLVLRVFKGEDIILPPMEYKGATTTKELELEDIKAQSRWIQSHLYSVEHANGDLNYVVNINMDLTKLKRAEIETQQQRDVLARIDRTSSMGQLTGSIAHELNQPLTGILSNAQAAEIMLKNKLWDEGEFKEILAEIISDTKRAGDVIRNLRALFQNRKTDILPIKINTIVKEVENLLHSEFVVKDINLTIQDASSLPMIMGNKIQIQQVLVNLIMNGIQAMDFMEREERTLLITTSLDAHEVKVLVEDKGKGIHPEIIDRIFEPLATWKPDGTGMGLAISNNIIVAHGGRMFADNKAHGGAIVGFTLPVIKEKE